MKIVVLDGYTENPGDLSWEGLGQLGELTVYERTTGGEDQIIQRIGDAQAVYTNKTPLSGRVFEACPGIRFVGVLAKMCIRDSYYEGYAAFGRPVRVFCKETYIRRKYVLPCTA